MSLNDAKQLSVHPTPDVVAHGDFVYRHSNVPIIVRTEGAMLYDDQGRSFLAAEAANGTAGLGFDSSILEESMAKVRAIPAVPSFCETGLRRRVAGRICEMMYQATGIRGRVCFELGGAQGMELALKIARANSEGSQYVVFEGGYHGRSAYTSQFSASHRYRKAVGDWRLPIVRLPYPDCEQCRFGQRRESCSHQCLSYLHTLTSAEFGGMATQVGKADVAAFVFEGVLNAGGIVKPDRQYLEGAASRFREMGAILVADEIFCGFYRTGKPWGFLHYDLVPDIVVMSKALTNGIVPLSCVWARADLMSDDAFPPGSHSATYLNYAMGLAVADTVLDRYSNWQTKEIDIAALESRLRQLVDNISSSSKRVISGMAIGGAGRLLLDAPIAGHINDIARTICEQNPIEGVHGAFLASTGMSPNVIAINPPLNIVLQHIDVLEELLDRSLRKASLGR